MISYHDVWEISWLTGNLAVLAVGVVLALRPQWVQKRGTPLSAQSHREITRIGWGVLSTLAFLLALPFFLALIFTLIRW
jgi:hypothetical protein